MFFPFYFKKGKCTLINMNALSHQLNGQYLSIRANFHRQYLVV